MSATWPYRLTGMIAFVRGVSAASISDASMLQVSDSMSTKTGLAPASTMASARGGEGEGRRDHLVARLQVEGHQRDQQRLGAAGHRDAVASPGECGERGLELRNLRTHDVLTVVEHALDTRVDATA